MKIKSNIVARRWTSDWPPVSKCPAGFRTENYPNLKQKSNIPLPLLDKVPFPSLNARIFLLSRGVLTNLTVLLHEDAVIYFTFDISDLEKSSSFLILTFIQVFGLNPLEERRLLTKWRDFNLYQRNYKSSRFCRSQK